MIDTLRGAFLLLVCLLSVNAWCQEGAPLPRELFDQSEQQPVKLDEDRLAEFLKDPDFDYLRLPADENSVWAKVKSWPGKMWNKLWNRMMKGRDPSGFFLFLFRALPYLAAAVLVGVLIWVLTTIETEFASKSRKAVPVVDLKNEDDIIKRARIPDLIIEAIGRGDFTLAIRYHYLHLLQLMSEKGLIQWQTQKTNVDYLDELGPGLAREAFEKVTHFYESVWYGSFAIEEGQYHEAERFIEKLKSQL